MVFSSLLFVYLFLPLCILVYKLTDGLDNKNTVLIIFSLIFYSWTGPKYLLLLLAMVFINWMAGLLMAGGKRYPARRKAGLWLALIGRLFQIHRLFPRHAAIAHRFSRQGAGNRVADWYFVLHLPAAVLQLGCVPWGCAGAALV